MKFTDNLYAPSIHCCGNLKTYNPSLFSFFLLVTGGESSDRSQEKPEFSQDVVDALEQLLQYTPLLDILDAKCSCNCIECLLKELLRNGLVTESHVTHFTSKRCVLPPALTFQDERYCITAHFSVCQLWWSWPACQHVTVVLSVLSFLHLQVKFIVSQENVKC